MTTEERRKLMKQLAKQAGNEQEASTKALEIEAPEVQTNYFTVNANDVSTRRQLMKQLANNQTETSYSKGVALADKEGAWIDSTYDRNTLTNYYNAYAKDLQRARENNDEVQYEKNALLLNRVAEKLGKQANVGTFLQDTASETGGNIRMNVADVARNVAKAVTELNPSINLNADVLYNVAKGEAGKLGDTVKNYRWGASEIAQLQSLYEKYPDDRVVNDLYKTVTKQGYTGDKQYFKDTVAYINQLERKQAYDKNVLVRNTQDEKNFMQNQKLKEELTYQEPIEEPSLAGAAKFTLQGVGTAAYMAPAIGTAVVSGGIAGGLGAGNSAVQTASQVGSLLEMYNAASGSAFDQTLREGYDWDKASTYGKLMGALEVTTELIGGESVNAALFNQTVGKTALAPYVSKLIEKGGSDVAKLMIALATDVASEATEEVMSALIEPLINYGVLGKDITLKEYWDGILDSAVGSVLPTLILGGYGKAQSISTINKTTAELLDMISEYRGKGSEMFSNAELTELENTVKEWSNRAKAGIEEHYDDVKKQTLKYEDVMNEIYNRLQTRPFVSLSIADFAQGVQDLEPQAREQAIINYAKSQGIDEARLRQMYGGYQEMFPYSYQQAEETINRWAQTPIAETQIQQPDKARLSKNVVNDYLKDNYKPGQVTPSTLVPPNDFNGTAYDWLKQYFKEENNNGVSRLVLEADNAEIQDGSIYGAYNANKVPTNRELNNSPVALDIEDIMNVENPSMGPGYYVYQNVSDALKDIENHFGTLEQFEYDSGGAYEIANLARKGKFTLNLNFENPDNPTMTWLPPKKQSSANNSEPGQTGNTIEETGKTEEETTEETSTDVEQETEKADFFTSEGKEIRIFKKGGHTGGVYTDGEYVYKPLTALGGQETKEAEIYEMLRGKEGIAVGDRVAIYDEYKNEYVVLRLPKFDYVVSVDDIPADEREYIGQRTDFLSKKYVDQILKGINAMVNEKITYNDPLQIGYKDGKAYIFDFSNSQISNLGDDWTAYLKEGYYTFTRFLNDFGAKGPSNIIEGAIKLLDAFKIAKPNNKWAVEAGLGENELKILNELYDEVVKNGINFTNVYRVSNARSIPLREGENEIRKTENKITDYGPFLVFSEKPLSDKFMDDWEISPIYENGVETPPKNSTQQDNERERNGKTFDKIENKYGTKQTETIDGKTITYINIDKQGKKFPYWQYFWFDNPLTTNDGKQDNTIDTGILDLQPVVAIVYERGNLTAKAFRNVHELKLWIKEHGGNSNFTIARNTSGSSYSLAIEDGEFVWRSDFDGRRVKPEVGPTIIEEAQSKFKTALKNPSKAVRHIDFRGKTFSDAAELANVMQPAIDPLGETLRVVFTKKEGGKERILGIEETSYNIHAMTNSTNYPNKAGSFLYEYGDFIARKAKALGADYVYEMHNHPGSSEPSGSYGGSDDLGSSTDFKKAINRGMQIEGYNFKYGGGLVLGYDGYSFYGGGNRTGFKNTAKKQGVYTSNGSLTNRDVFVQVPYTNGYKYNGFVDEPWVNMKRSLGALKDLAEQIPSEVGYSKVILSDLDYKPMYIGNIKNSALLQPPHKVNALLYELSRNYGGGMADVYSTNQAVLDNLKGKGMLVHTIDGIDHEYLKSPNKYIAYYEPRKGNSARSYVKWYTPKDEVVDDEDFIARNAKPKAEKKEPRHRLEKKNKQPSLLEEYNKRMNEKPKERETQDRYSLRPTALEFQNTDIEQTINKIENGEMEPELERARRSLADMRRYINKEFMKGRMGILKGPLSRTAYGVWKANSHWIRNTQMSDVSTWFHELGHEINSTALNMEALNKAMDANPNIRAELNTLCEMAFGDKYNKKPKTKLSEGFAEGIRRFVENPEKFSRDFTNVANMFVSEAEANKNFADTLAKLKVLSEMVKDYENQPGDERLISNVDMHGEGGKPIRVQGILNRLVDNIVEYMFNDAVYATKLTRQAAKKRGVKYTELKASEKFDDILKVKGNAQNIIQQIGAGTYDDYGHKITHGFREIMEEFLPTKSEAEAMGLSLEKARSKRIEDLVKYGIAIREKTLIDTREEDLMLGTRLNDIEYTINKYKNDAKIQRAMEMINDNSKALINYAVEKGLIKKSAGEQILRDNVMYFPLNRVMEDRLSTTLGNSRTGSTGKSIYRLEGSDLQISNPLISLMNNWGRIIYQIEHNDMLKALVAMGKDNDEIGYWFDTKVPPKMSFRGSVSMDKFKEAFQKELKAVSDDMKLDLPIDDMIDDMDFDEIYNLFVPEAGDPSQRMLSYLDKGVRKTIQFANNELGNGLFRLLTNLDTQKSNLFLNIMNKINMPLKVGATAWNVEFALSNMQSDAIGRFLYSNGAAFYIPIFTSMYNVGRYMNSRYAGKLPWKPEQAGELYEKFMRSGASQEGTFRGDQLWLRDHMKDVFGYAEDVLFGKKKITSFDDFRRKFNIKKSNIAEKLNYISEVSEQATRFAEFVMVYNQSIAKGFTEQEAIREAGMKARQVTQDFTVQGRLMREINKLVPFASATIGGLYRFGVEARNHPVRLTARLSALAAVAMLIEAMMDGEDRDYYEEINKQKRFDNFFFKNPDDPQHPFIIKKPQGPARYLVNLAQLMTNASMGRIPEDKIVDEFYDWLTMSVDDQLPVTKVEDLLPGGLQAFVENAVNKDFYYGTPIVSKDLEKLDPKDQYDEYTSEIAKAIGGAINYSPAKLDNIINTWFAGLGKQVSGGVDAFVRRNQENKAPAKDISEQIMRSKVFGNAFRSSESINEVYDRIGELETEEAEGRLTEEQSREYSKLQEAKSTLAQLNKKMKEVRENSSLSAEEKADKINTLREERIDTARYYLGKKVLNPSNQKKIEKIAYYPTNDTYTYTVNKKKYEVTFDEKLKEEYATEFMKEYQKQLEALKQTAAYKRSTEQEKLELEKKTRTAARTTTTNKMKKVAYQRQYGK